MELLVLNYKEKEKDNGIGLSSAAEKNNSESMTPFSNSVSICDFFFILKDPKKIVLEYVHQRDNRMLKSSISRFLKFQVPFEQ